jgi:putative ABC transport system permease protein
MQIIENSLERLLRRLPIGWLQLRNNRTRFFAAVMGITFANVLVFMQLGFKGALLGTIAIPYHQMNADILLSASDMNTMADGSPIPRQRRFQALGIDGIESATSVFHGRIEWKQPDGSIRNLDVFGVDPAASAFKNEQIQSQLHHITKLDVALMDRKTRNVSKNIFKKIEAGEPLVFETRQRTMNVVGTFDMGGGFTADGYLIVSDQTFLRLFPQRHPGAPDHIFVKVSELSKLESIMQSLSFVLPKEDTQVRTVSTAINKDVGFQTTQRPVGLIFGFGVMIGILVGIIIVYQVLSTDVADHMKEYATFKAIGYPHRFFLSIIFEEAMILGIVGFMPGLVISTVFYAIVSRVTGLPLQMTIERMSMLLLGSIVMCMLSGALAARKLAQADPAELFA